MLKRLAMQHGTQPSENPATLMGPPQLPRSLQQTAQTEANHEEEEDNDGSSANEGYKGDIELEAMPWDQYFDAAKDVTVKNKDGSSRGVYIDSQHSYVIIHRYSECIWHSQEVVVLFFY